MTLQLTSCNGWLTNVQVGAPTDAQLPLDMTLMSRKSTIALQAPQSLIVTVMLLLSVDINTVVALVQVPRFFSQHLANIHVVQADATARRLQDTVRRWRHL